MVKFAIISEIEIYTDTSRSFVVSFGRTINFPLRLEVWQVFVIKSPNLILSELL